MILKNLILNFYQIILFITILFFLFYIFLKYNKKSIEIIESIFSLFIKKFKKNKKILKILKNHPKKILFIIKRFKNDNFFQLPFTILFLIIIYILSEYIWITDDILNQDIITQIDIRLSDFFYYFKDSRLINLFLAVSYFWNFIIVLLISIITSLIFYIQKKKIILIWFISSISISSLIVWLSKIIIERPRPELAIYKENSFSFPSFHATISISLYWFIFYLLYLNSKTKFQKKLIIFLAIIFAFLLWFSRLYLNVHYLSDVIAWWYLWALGLFLWITIIWALNHFLWKKINFKKDKQNKKIYIFSSILILIFFILYYPIYYKNIQFEHPKKINYIEIKNVLNYFNKHPNLKYTETITWRKTEAINFIFITNNPIKIKRLFQNIWWKNADKLWRSSIKNMTKALLENKKYQTAPITPLYYNKKIQYYSFQKLTNKENIKFRHHIRIWKTNLKINNKFIFVGCWIYDDWLKWWITHKIDANIDKEREFIFWNLDNSPFIKNYKLIKLESSFSWTNFSWDTFFTNWEAYIINLK